MNERVVYISYDRFPSPKGAAVHIDAFVRALGAAFGPTALVAVSPDAGNSNPYQGGEYCPGVSHHALPAEGANLIERVLNFRARLRSWWQGRRPQVVHIRSIFEGYPIARSKRELCEYLVFEVNGLPSIELKYHYPDVAADRELLDKLVQQEQACIEAADLIVTVSQVNADHLVRRGADPDRICVIPNGVDPEVFSYRRPRPSDGRDLRLLYCGTISAWQGVHLAVEALSICRREIPARLTLVGDGRTRQWRDIDRRCHDLGVADFVQRLEPVSQSQLAEIHHRHDVVVAPLTANDRNLVQGCCPLKVIEAMASGTPLIASDLPVVTALARNGVQALLVKPGSAKAIAAAVLRLINDPHLATQLSASARRRVKQHLTWRHAQASLIEAYGRLLGGR